MNHSVHFLGPITQHSANCLLSIMQNILRQTQDVSQDKVTLYLSSEGGDLNSGFSLYNFLRSYPIPITIVNIGTIESIAVMIYLSADNRLAVEHSRFLLHSFHWGYPNCPVDYQRLSENSASLRFDTSRYISIFKERTKSAEIPINVDECLNGSAEIVPCSRAITAGICSEVIPAHELHTISDTYYWVDTF